MNLFAEMQCLRDELEKMEEERIQFSRMIKDVKRRLREFVVNLDKVNPSISEKIARGPKRNGITSSKLQTNQICYKRLSCNFDCSEEESKLTKMRKAKSFNKRNRPNSIKKRFRHSVIGNGDEFSGLDEALLLDACVIEEIEEENKKGKKTVDDEFSQYLKDLYSCDVVAMQKKKQETSWVEKNTETKIGKLIDIDDTLTLNSNLKRKSNKARHRRTYTDGLKDVRKQYEEYIMPDEIPDLFERKPHFLDADLSSVNAGSLASVVFSREQKRRLKKKMKQAFKKPENYFYMGNL